MKPWRGLETETSLLSPSSRRATDREQHQEQRPRSGNEIGIGSPPGVPCSHVLRSPSSARTQTLTLAAWHSEVKLDEWLWAPWHASSKPTSWGSALTSAAMVSAAAHFRFSSSRKHYHPGEQRPQSTDFKFCVVTVRAILWGPPQDSGASILSYKCQKIP